MKKVFDRILSWNWGFLFWLCNLFYWLKIFSNPDLIKSTPGGINTIVFMLCGSIAGMCIVLIRREFRAAHLSHEIPPQLTICQRIYADQALEFHKTTAAPIVYICSTNKTYKKVGYYKRSFTGWVLIESEQ